MRFRLITGLAAAATLLGALAPVAQARRHSTVLKVRSCQVGDSSKERRGTFYSRMRAVPGTSRMMMRFTVVDRDARGTAPVPSSQLARWRRSRRGVRTFGFAQTVTGLQAGGAYAVIVEYRWVGANGKTIKTARRTSAECRQHGELPNLRITRVAARLGDAAGTLVYSVDVTNSGPAAARDVVVDLFVDEAAADSATVDSVNPGETVTVRASGPACVQRLKAVVDRKDAIHETTEDDNVFRSRCPIVVG